MRLTYHLSGYKHANFKLLPSFFSIERVQYLTNMKSFYKCKKLTYKIVIWNHFSKVSIIIANHFWCSGKVSNLYHQPRNHMFKWI